MPDELQNEFDGSGFGTGALLRKPDWRDYQLACAPRIAPFVGQAPANDDHLLPYIQGTYNQGSLPSCVAHSFAGLMSIYEEMERGQWIVMDAVKCYQDNGGNGSNGVYSAAVLKYAQDQGMPVLNSGARYKISAYAFATPFDPAGIDTVKAAIWQGHPCKLAMLLPSDFMNGMTAGNAPINTSAYHEVVAVAYTPERVVFKNSWGEQYGQGGLGSVPWAYLQQPGQRNYSYFYTTLDAKDDGGSDGGGGGGNGGGGGGGGGNALLTVTGYQGAAGSVPQFKGGGPLTVTGTGLDSGVLQVTFGTAQLPVGLRSSISALVTLPAVEVPTCGVIKVQREAMAVSGPPLVVMPGSDPPPPGELSVSIAVSKRQTFIGIFAVVHDSSGALVTAQCSGTCGNILLGQRSTGGSSGVPAAWQAARHDGDAIRIVALAADGRSGIGTSTV